MTAPPSDENALLLALKRALADEEPPATLVASVQALGAPRPAGPGPLDRLARLVAELVQDSWSMAPGALGLRGGGADPAVRHLLYSADGRDIDLRVSADAGRGPDRWRINGQVLGPDARGEVLLAREGDAPVAVALDALGEFDLPGLVAGRYAVTIVGEGVEIVLPAIDIGTVR
jgi:hypothetical protein